MTTDGMVLDRETGRRDHSGRIIVKSRRGDNPKTASTNIGIYPYRHADLQLALKWRDPLRTVKTTPDGQEPNRFMDLPGCVFAPGEPPALIDSAGDLWSKYCNAKTAGIPDAASIEVEPARLQGLYEQKAWRRNQSRTSSARQRAAFVPGPIRTSSYRAGTFMRVWGMKTYSNSIPSMTTALRWPSQRKEGSNQVF